MQAYRQSVRTNIFRMHRIWKPALFYYAIVFGAGFVLGPIRVIGLVPRFGERTAELLEMPIMLMVILWASWWLVRRDTSAMTRPQWFVAGMLALLLVVLSELALVTLLNERSIAAYIAGRDPVSGSVYLMMLLVFGVMPACMQGLRKGHP